MTLAFIQHYMWLSKVFWLLALVNDVQRRLTKVYGISRVSAKKIQQNQLLLNNDDATASSQVNCLASIFQSFPPILPPLPPLLPPPSKN